MPVCPSCHRQQVVATAQFCPFCGYAFVLGGPAGPSAGLGAVESGPAPLYGPPGYGAPPYGPAATPGYPPPGYAPGYPPPAAPPLRSRSASTISPVAARTTSARAVAVTAAVALLAILVSFLLWRLISNPNPATDQAFSDWIVASHRALPFLGGVQYPLGAGPFDNGYTLFMILLVSIAPMAAVASYWFSLRRLYQEWAPSVWLKTSAISLLFFLLGVMALGVVAHTQKAAPSDLAGWALLMLFYYPALLLIVVLASAACAAAGILFGRWFARWPLERIRALHSSSWQDALLVGCTAFGALLLQDLIAPRLGLQQVVPLGALVVAALACWSALRPVAPATP